MPATINIFSIYSLVSIVVHVIGIANAGHAVMNVRSSRGQHKPFWFRLSAEVSRLLAPIL